MSEKESEPRRITTPWRSPAPGTILDFEIPPGAKRVRLEVHDEPPASRLTWVVTEGAAEPSEETPAQAQRDPKSWRDALKVTLDRAARDVYEVADHADSLQARHAALLEILRSLEWEGESSNTLSYGGYCPLCGGRGPWPYEGHFADCLLGRALAGAGRIAPVAISSAGEPGFVDTGVEGEPLPMRGGAYTVPKEVAQETAREIQEAQAAEPPPCLDCGLCNLRQGHPGPHGDGARAWRWLADAEGETPDDGFWDTEAQTKARKILALDQEVQALRHANRLLARASIQATLARTSDVTLAECMRSSGGQRLAELNQELAAAKAKGAQLRGILGAIEDQAAAFSAAWPAPARGARLDALLLDLNRLLARAED